MSALDAPIARLDALAAGAWLPPALGAMAQDLDGAIRAKLAGNRRAVGILGALRVDVAGDQLVIICPSYAARFEAADFARGDLSAYTASLSQIAARAVAAAME